MAPPTSDFIEILKVLSCYQVDFIIVGGVCAVLHGAPVTTFDLDIVYKRESGNIDRLIAALNGLEAIYRGRGEQKLKPTAVHLAAEGHFLLLTRAGPLDLLATIGHGHTFDGLLPRTVRVTVESCDLHILDLADLIEIKLETVRDKDKYTLMILQQVLNERERKKSNES